MDHKRSTGSYTATNVRRLLNYSAMQPQNVTKHKAQSTTHNAQSTKLEFITFTHKFVIVKECEILEGTVPSLHVGSHAEWIVWNVTVEKYSPKLQGTVRLRVL